LGTSKILYAAVIMAVAGALTTFSLTQGQSQPVAQPQGPPKGPAGEPPRPGRNLAKWSYFEKEIYFSGQRGSEWLQRANCYDGRFVYCHVPALRSPLEPDGFMQEATAASALARASRYYGDDKAAALARQAVLTLLKIDTALEDPKNPTIRGCTLPSGMVNRFAAVAVLVQAIHDLPDPAADLLNDSEQLCNYLRRAQRPDGSFACSDNGPDGKPGADDNDTINLYSGEALYALVRSQQQRPAPWKTDAVRKALTFYQARWRAGKNMVLVPRHTAAYAEAYHQTKEQACADFVFEMNDWLCGFQFAQLDPLHPLWLGGFMSCVEGRPAPTSPTAASAVYIASLAEAVRVARLAGDAKRFDRYKESLERGLQFLVTLQYSDANTQHFAEWYRPALVGGFHTSHTDGNLRLDCTQEAVRAVMGYLSYVKEVP
jgi:SAM-dependent methyltransferase